MGPVGAHTPLNNMTHSSQFPFPPIPPLCPTSNIQMCLRDGCLHPTLALVHSESLWLNPRIRRPTTPREMQNSQHTCGRPHRPCASACPSTPCAPSPSVRPHMPELRRTSRNCIVLGCTHKNGINDALHTSSGSVLDEIGHLRR